MNKQIYMIDVEMRLLFNLHSYSKSSKFLLPTHCQFASVLNQWISMEAAKIPEPSWSVYSSRLNVHKFGSRS